MNYTFTFDLQEILSSNLIFGERSRNLENFTLSNLLEPYSQMLISSFMALCKQYQGVQKVFTNCAVLLEAILLLDCFSLWIIPGFSAITLVTACFFVGILVTFHIPQKWLFLKIVESCMNFQYSCKCCCFHVIICLFLLFL